MNSGLLLCALCELCGETLSSITRTASQRNSPPTTCSPRANWSRSPNPLSAIDAQTHLHSGIGATLRSSTTKISAPSKRASNKHPNIDPTHHSIHVCKNRRAPVSRHGRQRPPNSIPSLPSVERCARRPQAKIIFRDASARPQSSASASHPFARSAHLATSTRHASQIAFATPSRCDRPTNPRYFHRARIANIGAKFPATAC
jgi:hypothetical protein